MQMIVFILGGLYDELKELLHNDATPPLLPLQIFNI